MTTAPSRPQFKAQMSAARVEPAPAAGELAPIAGEPRVLLHLAGGAAFVVDPALRCLAGEGDALRLAGLASSDVVGRPLGEIVAASLAARLEPQCRLALEGQTFAFEHDADGRAYLSRGLPLHDAAGGVYAALVVTYDITDRKQAESRRRRSEETFSALIEHAPFGVYVVDARFRLRAVNRGAESVFHGIEPLLGRDFAEIVPALWPAPVADDVVGQFRRTLATGEPYAAPRRAESRGGRMQAYDWQLQRITLPDGTAGVVCYSYDLTAIREAEQVLTEAAARSAFLVAFADAMRPLTSAREIARTAATLLGREMGVAKAAWVEVDDGGEPTSLGAALGEELRAGRVVAVADAGHDVRLDGEARAAVAAAGCAACLEVPLIEAGRLAAVLSLGADAARTWSAADVALAREVAERTWTAIEQAQAGARLRDSEARLKLALDASEMGSFVWYVDEDRGEPDARTRALLGLDASGPTLAAALQTRLHPGDRPRCAAAVARALDPAGPGTLREDVRIRRPDGSGERWIALTARTAFEGEPRRAVRVAGLVADVTDRKATEDTQREREAHLKDADRRKDEFLAVLAHELRNPLAPIRTGLELIRLGGDDAAAVERTRGVMERQVGHMVRLIDDLLDVSRITSGKITLQRRPTPLDGLVATAVEASRQAIQAAGLTLQVELPATPAWLDVDPTRGVQILANVIHNAVKFTDAGGRIRIGAEVLADASSPHGVLALTVADSGVGISAEMLPRVFDLFSQDRGGGGRSQSGLGIGLALARRLVLLHGGTIEADSEGPGKGSAFTIRLPMIGAAEAAEPAPAPRTISRIRHRVVVIDDNVDAANAVAMLIAAHGGEARTAADGATGLERVLEWRPDLVLLDIGMPGLDGYATCRRIREAMGSEVTVVALTGWGQEQDKREAARAGFDAHLTKPADPAALERLLAQIQARPR
jgi:PAS domain S-box-containing protein